MVKRGGSGIIAVVLLIATTSRAQDVPANPVAAAQSALVQLDQLRVVEANNPQRALELLKQGTEALAQASRRIADEPVAAPSTAPAGRSRRPDAAQKDALAQRRLNLCQIAFMQAELHRRAAEALPADHPERAVNLEQSLVLSKAMRIDYRDLVAGRLGYAAAARVHRARGELDQAEEVLSNVAVELDERRLAREPAAVLQVQRVLWLERVEAALEKSPAAGRAMADALTRSTLITAASPVEQAALKWLTTQSAANVAIANNEGDVNAIAQAIRDPALAEGAPEHRRLALLVSLHRQRGLALTAPEQLQWGRLQAWAGLQDAALETYAAAAKAHPQDVSPADWVAYGSLLHAAGQADRAAEALAKGLESVPVDAPQRVAVLQAIAAGRVQAAREKGADEATRKLATDALWQLIEATNDIAIRRDSLRSWAHFHQQAGTFGEQLPAIEKFREDVLTDPYLCLLVSDAKWRIATSAHAGPATEPATGPGTGPGTAAATTAELAQEILANLARLLPDAEPDLAPSLILLMAQVSAATPGGARAALDVLARHQDALKPDAPATPHILGLKLRLLMDLGLTGEAEAIAAQLQHGAVPTEAALKLAGMLADRYVGSDAPPAARDQIVQLVSRGLAQHGGQDAKYRESALAAAATLLKVKAYADAQQILGGLKSAGAPEEKDPAVALLSAAAMQGQGKIEEAQKLLTAVARENPQAGEVHLAIGRLQHQLQQWEPAAAAYRDARKQLPVGGEPWWAATIGLAETLVKQGNPTGAQELLRVANAMYRNRAPASLLPRIDTLLRTGGGNG